MEDEPLLPSHDGESRSGEKSIVKNLLFLNLVMFILTLSGSLFMPVMSQYLYHRVSEDVFNHTLVNMTTTQPCYRNTSSPDYMLQEKAQQVTAEKQLQFTMLKSALAIFSNIMLGAYSDSIGRKFLFVTPMTGQLIRSAFTTVIIGCRLDLNLFFLSEGIDGLLGSYYGILLASYTYTADNTPATGSRTIGIAVVDLTEFLATSLISIASGYFIQDVNFFYPALTATLVCMVALLIVTLFLPTSTYHVRDTGSTCMNPVEGLKRVFGFYVFDNSALKKACFILILLSFVFNVISSVGGSNIDTLFLLNAPFCWTPEKLAYYVTAFTVLCPLIGVPLTRLFQVCLIDEIIAVIATSATVASDVIHSFASTDTMMYIVVGVTSIGSTLSGITRAIMSRMAPPNRQGSLFASIAVVETICSLVGSPLFSRVYQGTVVIWRGLVFIVMAGMHVVAAVILVVFIFVSRPVREEQKRIRALNVQETEEDTRS
ncbi:lysosomal proton-coupled steroid conjugate and bile acid symporter SLC46A3-like [Haliotis cracherodii]|uniref:lysosomal proton-coupled steroid conjugate and bile acid symporter SLC46A3-like n=1 Tax=Haliotis cracherodii TaxID=6455 RepID=UPI0039EA9D89